MTMNHFAQGRSKLNRDII